MVLKEILKKHVTNFEKLLDDAGFINGVWVKTGSHGHFDVDNPANGEILATLPDMGKEETSAAIQAAFEAQKEWAERTSAERSRLLRKWHDLLIANRDAVAAIMLHKIKREKNIYTGNNLFKKVHLQDLS